VNDNGYLIVCQRGQINLELNYMRTKIVGKADVTGISNAWHLVFKPTIGIAVGFPHVCLDQHDLGRVELIVNDQAENF
jgi:hypothetical protein